MYIFLPLELLESLNSVHGSLALKFLTPFNGTSIYLRFQDLVALAAPSCTLSFFAAACSTRWGAGLEQKMPDAPGGGWLMFSAVRYLLSSL